MQFLATAAVFLSIDVPAQKTSSDWWLVIFTAALVVVGFFQLKAFLRQEKWMRENVGVAERSANAARESAAAATNTMKLMRKISRKELRARVFVQGAKRLGATSGPGSFDAEITIKNFGKIPAYRCTYRFGLILATNPVPDDQVPALQRTGQEPMIVLPPDGEVTITKTLPLGTFANIQHTQVGQGSHAVYLYGDIQYRDGFGKQRVSKFLMKCCGFDYGMRRFSFCERGNEAN